MGLCSCACVSAGDSDQSVAGNEKHSTNINTEPLNDNKQNDSIPNLPTKAPNNDGKESKHFACQSLNCPCIARMTSALILYSTIDPTNTKHESKLMSFCDGIYPELMDDYIHIMEQHQHDVDRISDRIKTDLDLMTECHNDYKNCALLSRQYRNKSRKDISSFWNCQRCLSTNLASQSQCRSCSDGNIRNVSFYVNLLDNIHQ